MRTVDGGRVDGEDKDQKAGGGTIFRGAIDYLTLGDGPPPPPCCGIGGGSSAARPLCHHHEVRVSNHPSQAAGLTISSVIPSTIPMLIPPRLVALEIVCFHCLVSSGDGGRARLASAY
uniref:Uncharacterized protein n=1 Tax=Chromera velia CCMP2878 TaxID=1169474 RepID=A0A0G4GU35_9ALVE|eukprot:Cvel_23383.t1-p1 / transcript=Cvel_23383.t1 / gene=Cvel_23383 / organism=Chromera_velia_CCMP2878 / gene_product=hypothetical protein / transcript_product=hypothetical protein / location=Cvel_scaffold2403:16107-20366(+) / protein_length=117 / sequence_SO=supercontig / SO=protein_coding / is_pseudo=false